MDKSRNPLAESDFGKLWLGCFVKQLGGDEGKIRCRGEITDYSIETITDEHIVKIHQETAWVEQEEVRFLIRRTFPSVEVLFIEEELSILWTRQKGSKYLLSMCIDSFYANFL